MQTDMEILRAAYDKEKDPRNRWQNWEFYAVGATKADIKRLEDDGMVCISMKSAGYPTKYKLTEKAKKVIWSLTMEAEFDRVPTSNIMDAFEFIVGFDDLKEQIAKSISSQRRIHFMLEGPPACAKSLILEGVRASVPGSYPAFGSRTSAAGLSDALFENHPRVLLLDEADKVHMDGIAILLGLMESGEILETKSRKTRGVTLNCMVIAACNSSSKMPPEFLSRFSLHAHFPKYTREEFIDVCIGFLGKKENCPPDIAELLGTKVFDYNIGDVRKARGAWLMMDEATEEEANRAIRLMLKYGTENQVKATRQRRLL
jgi:hypothetical protein